MQRSHSIQHSRCSSNMGCHDRRVNALPYTFSNYESRTNCSSCRSNNLTAYANVYWKTGWFDGGMRLSYQRVLPWFRDVKRNLDGLSCSAQGGSDYAYIITIKGAAKQATMTGRLLAQNLISMSLCIAKKRRLSASSVIFQVAKQHRWNGKARINARKYRRETL